MGLRLALVLGSSTGGVGRHVRTVAAGLVARGETVTVYGPRATGDQFDFTGAGAGFVPVEIPASPRLRDAVAVRALRAAWRPEPPDVIHAHGLRAGLVAGLARTGTTPLVVTWHNLVLAGGLRARVLGLLERRVAGTASVTLAISADVARRATSLGAVDVRPAVVVAPRLAPPQRDRAEVREELGVPAGAPLVLSVGRLHPQKAHEVLVAAAARWRTRTPPPVVVIAGTGPDYLRLAALISAQRAPVTLLGHRGDVPDLLAAADVAVTTGVWEGRQLFAQEALWAGVPLVATAVGGSPELLGDGAVLVTSGDVDAVDAQVCRLLDDPEHRAAVVARGHAQAATWPGEADELAQLVGVYAELAGPRSAQARRAAGDEPARSRGDAGDEPARRRRDGERAVER